MIVILTALFPFQNKEVQCPVTCRNVSESGRFWHIMTCLWGVYMQRYYVFIPQCIIKSVNWCCPEATFDHACYVIICQELISSCILFIFWWITWYMLVIGLIVYQPHSLHSIWKLCSHCCSSFVLAIVIVIVIGIVSIIIFMTRIIVLTSLWSLVCFRYNHRCCYSNIHD